jgi:probable HAF family extracellular repeat protein
MMVILQNRLRRPALWRPTTGHPASGFRRPVRYRQQGTLATTLTALACFFLLGIPEAGAAPGHTRTVARYIVEPLDAGNVPLTPRAINDRGQIVGSIEHNDGRSQAFLWQDGKLTLLRTLGGVNSAARAVNNRGQIVGFAETRDGRRHPVVWSRGRVRGLGSLHGKEGEAWAINDRGEVVGDLHDSGFIHQSGFVYRRGRMSQVRVQKGFWLMCSQSAEQRI